MTPEAQQKPQNESGAQPPPLALPDSSQTHGGQGKAQDAPSCTIGGSNIGGIIGVSPYSSPFQEWLKITGQAVEDPGKMPLRLGRLFERSIAEWYSEATGKYVQWSNIVSRHTDNWRRASADAFVWPERNCYTAAERGLECKFVGARQAYRWGDLDTDEVPAEYVAQCLWYIDFYKLPQWDIAAVFDTNDARIYTIREDREAQAGIREAADKFYHDHVLTGDPPPIDASEKAKAWLKGRFPKDIADMRQATKAEMQLLAEYCDARRQATAFKSMQETLGERLKMVIGEGAGFESEDGKATWKKARDSEETDWQAIAEIGLKLLEDHVESTGNEYPRYAGIELLRELCGGLDRDSIVRHYTRTVEGSRRLTAKLKGE